MLFVTTARPSLLATSKTIRSLRPARSSRAGNGVYIITRPGAAGPRSAATTARPGWLSRAESLLTCCGSRPPALVLRLVELDFPVDLVPVFAVVRHGRFYQPGWDLQVLGGLGH